MATLFPSHETSINLARVFAEAGATLNVRFTTQYFVPLLTFCEQKLAYGLVDPIAVESYGLYRDGAGPLVFLPIVPRVDYRTMLLSPAYRPASMLAEAFLQRLADELLRLGGEQLAPAPGQDPDASLSAAWQDPN